MARSTATHRSARDTGDGNAGKIGDPGDTSRDIGRLGKKTLINLDTQPLRQATKCRNYLKNRKTTEITEDTKEKKG